MPSVKNPNTPNKTRRVANRAKVQKRKSQAGVSKNPRGTAASSVLHPTSGPAAPLSGKKARKVEKARAYAKQRALEQALEEQGEVVMTDAPKATKPKAEKAAKGKKADEETMDVDGIA